MSACKHMKEPKNAGRESLEKVVNTVTESRQLFLPTVRNALLISALNWRFDAEVQT
jgi:hypothetical protein